LERNNYVTKIHSRIRAIVPQALAERHYSTDDPVTCEEFVQELLGRGFKIEAIKHEGLDLPRQDFDRLIKTAAETMASKSICASLNIKPDEAKFRFGLAA
jgi:hypothetical protein